MDNPKIPSKFIKVIVVKMYRKISNIVNLISKKKNKYVRKRWIINKYSRFNRIQHQENFIKVARFLQINRPINGYYFEFGCNEGNTFREAWDAFHHLFDFTYIAFDSFEGLPDIEEIDKQDIWKKGKLAYPEEELIKVILKHGIPMAKFRTVKGFYENTLTIDLQNELLPTKAAVIHIDCDLYTSTVSVLNFIVPFLQKGSVVIFDDWACFCCDPKRGERKAFREFLERYPQLKFELFYLSGEQSIWICVV